MAPACSHCALCKECLGTDWFSCTASPYQLEPCDKKGKASIHSPRASSYLLLTNWQKWISSSPCSRWQKVEKWGSLNKPIKKNNQESNSDGDPWLERPGSGCCSTTGISGARKGHASCCRALPHPLLALTLQVIPYTCPTYSIF